MIKKSSTDLNGKLDTIGHNIVILGGEGDDTLLPAVSPDELWTEYGVPLQEDSSDGVPIGVAFNLERDVLVSISKVSKTLLEIGTGEGATTLIMAKHSVPEATVHTIDLPADIKSIVYERGDSPIFAAVALRERTNAAYKYATTDYVKKVNQIYADTKSFDETKLANKLDFIFIDGAATYSYVKNDTQKALSMLKPGGIMLWHHYESKHPDVVRFINEFAQKNKVHHIKGTSFAIYKMSN